MIGGGEKGGQIPVFTVIPPNVKHGALFDIGADYHEVGRLTGVLAAGASLNGKKPGQRADRKRDARRFSR